MAINRVRQKWACAVKSKAHYTCIKCGSTENIQAHDPTRSHVDPRDGKCLCGNCHADEHPEVPRALFLCMRVHQPYWENKSAATLAREIGVHPRTIYRVSKRLKIERGVLGENDALKIKQAARHRVSTNPRSLVDLKQLKLELSEMGSQSKLYEMLKEELTLLGRWKTKPRWNPKKGYQVMREKVGDRYVSPWKVAKGGKE